ncbi:MAG TPA: carbonic anhydrase family protein [Thermoanaerobaculia bacterium]|nr:carbonic anhydrase family protein [Thermoanaerobaculia bacterium]
MRLKRISFSLILILAAVTVFAADETCPITSWSYPEGPANPWPATYCSGANQSPIANNASQRTQDQSLPLAVVNYAGNVAFPITLKNTGTELKATPMFDGRLTWGTVSAQLTQFHFHVPAEHKLDIWADAAAELHLVHQVGDRIYVIAVAIRRGHENPALTALLKLAPRACYSAASISNDQRVLMKALLPLEMRRYITYEGSLTTPQCNRGVTFILMNDGIEASAEQIDRLKIIRTPTGNARAPQANGNRVTYRTAGK